MEAPGATQNAHQSGDPVFCTERAAFDKRTPVLCPQGSTSCKKPCVCGAPFTSVLGDRPTAFWVGKCLELHHHELSFILVGP